MVDDALDICCEQLATFEQLQLELSPCTILSRFKSVSVRRSATATNCFDDSMQKSSHL
jgi:hypothetical protein